MKRREFITLVGGAAATWPLAAWAQQAPKRMLRVGALIGFAEHDPATQRRVATFLKGLADLGWTLDRNVAIDFRYGAGNADRNRAFAKELVSLIGLIQKHGFRPATPAEARTALGLRAAR